MIGVGSSVALRFDATFDRLNEPSVRPPACHVCAFWLFGARGKPINKLQNRSSQKSEKAPRTATAAAARAAERQPPE